MTQLNSGWPGHAPFFCRYHGERCYVTPVEIQEDAALVARRGEMDDSFKIGDAGAVKNVSGPFES